MTRINSSKRSEAYHARASKRKSIENKPDEGYSNDNIFPWDGGMIFKEGDTDESHELFKTIGENIQEGLAVVDDKNVIYINDRACEIFECSKGELIKLKSIDIAAPEEKERLKQINRDIAQLKKYPKDLEFWIISKKGTKRCIHNHYSAIHNGNNSVSRFLITNDITERKLVEEDLKKRMMKFKLEDGHFYLVKESTLKMALEAFKDILKIGYHGLAISRTPESD